MNSMLIVEDDEDLRLELTDYLSARGFAVQGVGTLAAADQLLNPDLGLLLLDINLPDGSGMEFCQRVRPYVRAGIVMMTGRSERELRIQGLKDGADAYLVKPVDPEELEATLQCVARRARGPHYSMVPTAPMPVQWRLDRVRLTLSGPSARSCSLSRGEDLLLAALLEAKGQQISRGDLLAKLTAQGAPGGSHRVEALISRLRGKVLDQLRVELPVQSIYGRGYCFKDHAVVIRTRET